jgi:hydroxyethylthiazole kinase
MPESLDPWGALERLRERVPLVHCITNYVAMDVAANALLAIGASPAMVHAVEEVEEFVGLASALTINIGTLSPRWVEGMELAADRAVSLGRPWVLDPVGAGATSYRTGVARELAHRGPAIIRGNASEIMSVAGAVGGTRGVDSTRGADEARPAAEELAAALGCVVVVTGRVDYATDGARTLATDHGHSLMTRVTALGCALTAILGAFAAVEPDPLLAAAYGTALFGMAGDRATAGGPVGPGTLRVRLLDALHGLGPGSGADPRISDAR